MIQTTAHIRGTRREMRAAIRELPALISGRRPDVGSLGRTFKSHFAYYWFEKVSSAFRVKSLGGTDDIGQSWPPLSRKTIALRAAGPKDFKKVRGQGKSPLDERVRGLLTPAQDALWRGIFKSTFLRLISRTSPENAKAIAARTAWAILKSQGAQTKLQVLGSRRVPIGIDSGRLLAACSPGRVSGHDYIPASKDQIVEYRHGEMGFEIRVPYAGKFHKYRKIWPSQRRSGDWLKYAARKALEAVVSQIAQKRTVK